MEPLAIYAHPTNPRLRAVIVQDETPESPREWDNQCIFHFKNDSQYSLPQEFTAYIEFAYFDKDQLEYMEQNEIEMMEQLVQNYHIFGMYYANYSCAGPLFFKECDYHDTKCIGVALIKKEDIEHSSDAKTAFLDELTLWQQYNE